MVGAYLSQAPAIQENVILSRKKIIGTNALAYFVKPSVTKTKKVVTTLSQLSSWLSATTLEQTTSTTTTTATTTTAAATAAAAATWSSINSRSGLEGVRLLLKRRGDKTLCLVSVS